MKSGCPLAVEFVPNAISFAFGSTDEIDFVMRKRGKPPIAIECKWSAEGLDVRNLAAFRQIHAQGDNFVVCRDVPRAYRRSVSGVEVQFINLDGLIARLQATS